MKRRKNHWKRADSRLQWYCRKLTKKQRVVFIATAFVLFLTSCLYVITASLCDFGTSGGGLEIEHIRPLDMRLKKDTIIHFKDYYDYGHPQNQDTVRLVA